MSLDWAIGDAAKQSVGRYSTPPIRLRTYAAQWMDLPNSPSLTMSIPASAWLRTTSITDRRSTRSYSAWSNGPPSRRASRMRRNSGGRTRLPTCVVRMRSVLCTLGASPPRRAVASVNSATSEGRDLPVAAFARELHGARRRAVPGAGLHARGRVRAVHRHGLDLQLVRVRGVERDADRLLAAGARAADLVEQALGQQRPADLGCVVVGRRALQVLDGRGDLALLALEVTGGVGAGGAAGGERQRGEQRDESGQ